MGTVQCIEQPSLVLCCRSMLSTVAMLPPQAMASLLPWLRLRMAVSWEPMARCIPSKQAYGEPSVPLSKPFSVCACLQ